MTSTRTAFQPVVRGGHEGGAGGPEVGCAGVGSAVVERVTRRGAAVAPPPAPAGPEISHVMGPAGFISSPFFLS